MLAELPDGPARAEAGYRQFRQLYAGSAGELFAPLIPLLLGKKQTALADALAFRQRMGDEVRHWPVPLPQIADYLAGLTDGDTLVRTAGDSPLSRCESHHAIGYSLLAAGDRVGAREHFRKAVDSGAFLSNGFLDSRIILVRMDNDPTWPPWLPIVTN